MAIKPCTNCGHEVLGHADKCPNCGASIPGTKTRDAVVLVISLLGIGFFLVNYLSGDGKEKNKPVSTASIQSAQAKRPEAPLIKPEMIVTFSQGAVACITKEELLEMTMHAIKGEITKAKAMKGCIMVSPNEKVKVLSVEYNDVNNPDMGVVEIVGTDSKSSDGVWAYTIGAREVAQ